MFARYRTNTASANTRAIRKALDPRFFVEKKGVAA